jgi:hypothetical protein
MYFYIQGTNSTPSAIMNDGLMRITGKAVPLEQQVFFGQINKQISRYVKKPANKTSVEISLTHVNASSKRSMVEFLKQLESLNKQGFEVEVNWRYDCDNEDVKELGEIFRSMFDVSIHLMPENQ